MPKDKKKKVDVRPWDAPGGALDQAMRTPEMQDQVIKGAGETALSLMAGNSTPRNSQVNSGMINRGIQDETTMGDTAAVNSLSGLDAAKPGTELAKQKAPVTSTSAKGGLLRNLIDSGKMLGRGLVEGALGMPESVQGSTSSIPYTVGKLPGDIVRTKVGLPTSTQSTVTKHSMLETAGELPPTTYNQMITEAANGPAAAKAIMSNPKLMAQYGIRTEEEAKMFILNHLVKKYNTAKYNAQLKSTLGMKSGMEDAFLSLANKGV